MADERDGFFWLRWVAANTLAEAVGLSAVLLAGFGVLAPAVAGLAGAWLAVLSLSAGVLLGIFEGLVVGLAQAAVLRRRRPSLSSRTWVLATIIGATVAWGLGMLPSTLMAGAAAGDQAAVEPAEWLTLVLAAGLGLVAGVVLALAQWRALRLHVLQAWLWLPANAVAWLCGMPLVFLAMDRIPRGASVLQAVPIVVAGTAAAGAVVGALHGAVLVRLLRAPGRNL